MANQEIRNEIASFIEENMDRIVEISQTTFVQEYPRAHANSKDFEAVQKATYADMELWIGVLKDSSSDDMDYRNRFASAMVDPNDIELTLFAGTLSGILFEGRLLAPLLFEHYYMHDRKGREILEEFEQVVYEQVDMNCKLFSERMGTPGTIMGRWDLLRNLNGGLNADGDSPAKRFMDSKHYSRVIQKSAEVQKPEGSALTKREEEVLRILMEGKTNKEIGELLKIGESTVKKHISHIFDKYNVFSRAELMAKVHVER